jgi:hypothetical protein
MAIYIEMDRSSVNYRIMDGIVLNLMAIKVLFSPILKDKFSLSIGNETHYDNANEITLKVKLKRLNYYITKIKFIEFILIIFI